MQSVLSGVIDKMVEEKALNSPPLTKKPKSQLTAKQPSTKGLEPSKRDILHPKTEKKPQQDGRKGAFMIQSIPIPCRWVTHKVENSYTAEVVPHK